MSDELADDQEYVYAIAHPQGYVKIGRSTNPTRRLQSCQTGSPYDLWLLGQFPVDNPDRVETELHEHFANSHERGEWFRFTFDDYDELVDVAKMADVARDFDSIDQFKSWQQRKMEALL